MKKLIYFLVIIIAFPFFGFTQVIDDISYMSPFHDGVAALKKGGEWAFVDEKGTIVIAYRDDLVPMKINNVRYPIFRDGRALIKILENGVTYYGFIDTKGNTVIEPQFINAKNFNYEKAIVTKLTKTKLGYNKVIGKPVVSYEFQEIVIDNFGNIKAYLTDLKPISNLKPLSKIPNIESKMVSKNLVITKKGKELKTLTKI